MTLSRTLSTTLSIPTAICTYESRCVLEDSLLEEGRGLHWIIPVPAPMSRDELALLYGARDNFGDDEGDGVGFGSGFGGGTASHRGDGVGGLLTGDGFGTGDNYGRGGGFGFSQDTGGDVWENPLGEARWRNDP